MFMSCPPCVWNMKQLERAMSRPTCPGPASSLPLRAAAATLPAAQPLVTDCFSWVSEARPVEGDSPSRARGPESGCVLPLRPAVAAGGLPGLGGCQRRAGTSEASALVVIHPNKAPEDRGFLGTMCSLTDCLLSKNVRKWSLN